MRSSSSQLVFLLLAMVSVDRVSSLMSRVSPSFWALYSREEKISIAALLLVPVLSRAAVTSGLLMRFLGRLTVTNSDFLSLLGFLEMFGSSTSTSASSVISESEELSGGGEVIEADAENCF